MAATVKARVGPQNGTAEDVREITPETTSARIKVAVIEDDESMRHALAFQLRTAGFEPTLLSEWSERVAYKAEALEGVPEYLQRTYEGVRFVKEADGVLRNASVGQVGPARRRSALASSKSSTGGPR